MAGLVYTVHSCHRHGFPTKAKLGDREVDATVPGLVVELVSHGHGHTFRLIPESDQALAEALELFTPETRVAVSFARAEEK